MLKKLKNAEKREKNHFGAVFEGDMIDFFPRVFSSKISLVNVVDIGTLK